MKKLATLAAAAGLAACTATEPPATPAGTSKPSHTADQAASDTKAVTGAPRTTRPILGPELYEGTGRFAADTWSDAAEVSMRDPVTLQFDNAPLDEVVRVILADTLRASYVIDDRVTGSVTLETAAPIDAETAIAALETVLRMNGAALIIDGDVFKVIPASEATHATLRPQLGDTTDYVGPGHSLRIIPLRYVSAGQMRDLMTPFLPADAAISTDAARNLLVVAGTSSEVTNLIATAALFDIDLLAGMSVGIVPLDNVTPAPIIEELTAIFQSQEGGPLQHLVRLMPIDRLNAVLILSQQPGYMEQAKTWIERLDRGTKTGPQLYVYPLRYAKAEEVAPLLDEAFRTTSITDDDADETIRIIPDPQNNALILRATADEYERIEAALFKLDIAPVQVMVEATVAEVTLTNDLRYGLQWLFNTGDFGLSPNGTGTLSSGTASTLASAFPGFSFVTLEAQAARLVLDTLDEVTHVDVISSPMLMVLDNQSADLQVGNQVPVATQQATQTTNADAPLVNTVTFRDTGVILRVTPRVNASGALTLDIEQEVSAVVPTPGAGTLTPTISQRRIRSSVLVHSGETVVLGGLISDQSQEASSGLPYLSRVPVIGGLFGRQEEGSAKTELLVMITPRVITNRDEARDAAREVRQRLSSVKPFARIGRHDPFANAPYLAD